MLGISSEFVCISITVFHTPEEMGPDCSCLVTKFWVPHLPLLVGRSTADLLGIPACAFGSMPRVFGIFHIKLFLLQELAHTSIIVMSVTFHRYGVFLKVIIGLSDFQPRNPLLNSLVQPSHVSERSCGCC